jgi:hypothetical protein
MGDGMEKLSRYFYISFIKVFCPYRRESSSENNGYNIFSMFI